MNSPQILQSTLEIDANWRQAFQNSLAQRGKSENTQISYQQDLKAFTEWFLTENGEEFQPELINSWDLRAYRTWCLQAARLSPATWNRRRATLMIFCRWARKAGFIHNDPMEDIPAYETVAQAPRWLEKNEFGKLMRQLELNLNAANTGQRRERALRDGGLVALMVFAGLRVSEVCALQAGDVALSEKRGRVTVRLGKGEKQRIVPLNSEARRWLGEWLKACGEIAKTRILFPNYDAGPLTMRAIEKRLAQIGTQAGVKELTPHRLRHTCAKRLIDSGTPLTVVQRILGHATIETTARYAMAGWEDIEEAVEGITLGKRRSNG